MNHKGWIKALVACVLTILFAVGAFFMLFVLEKLFNINIIELDRPDSNNLVSVLILTIASLLSARTIEGKWHLNKIGITFNYKNISIDLLFGFLLAPLLFSFFLLINLSFQIVNIRDIEFESVAFFNMFMLFVLVAINEEILNRGIIQRYLSQSFNKYFSLIIASIIFALMHLANPNITIIGFINLIISGLALGGVYFITRNLWFSISYHFSWNFFQSISGFNVSGNEKYTVLILDFSENDLISGGTFGAEGSLFMLALQLLSFILIWTFFKTRISSLKETFNGAIS